MSCRVVRAPMCAIVDPGMDAMDGLRTVVKEHNVTPGRCS